MSRKGKNLLHENMPRNSPFLTQSLASLKAQNTESFLMDDLDLWEKQEEDANDEKERK